MIDKDDLYHWGVLGMRWGTRRGSSSSGTNSGIDKNLEKKKNLLLKAISERRIRTKADIHNMTPEQLSKFVSTPAMKRKIKHYENVNAQKNVNKVKLITALAMFGLAAFGPSIYRTGSKVYKFARAKKYDSMVNKYGGFDPDKVVNAVAKSVARNTNTGLMKI